MSNLDKIIKKEGDYSEWIYESQSGIQYKCIIKRNKHIKNLCGYVVLTKDNKFYGKDYDDIPVQVHGGLTFSSEVNGEWLIGFDCAHHGDITPGCGYEGLSYMGTYKDMNFVKSECESLAEQISNHSISKIREIKLGKLI